MSNRAERRRRERDGQGRRLTSLGMTMKVEGQRFDRIYNASPEDSVAPGEHVWAMFMVHQVHNLDELMEGEYLFDLESLILTTGPGCYVCEQIYTPEIAATQCPGQPPGELGYIL